MADPLSGTAALIMFLGCTAAILAFTVVWGLTSSRPIRHRRHVTGRPAVPYWHSPTGLQDERGIHGR